MTTPTQTMTAHKGSTADSGAARVPSNGVRLNSHPVRHRTTRHLLFLCSLLIAVCQPAVASEAPIELETRTGTIRGTLALPDLAHAPPVVLIIAGSGPTDRNGNAPVATGINDHLKLLAAALSKAGIASVRYDKRGVGQSAAALRTESELRFEDYVRDAEAWISKLSSDSRFASVGIVGHSEGALIGTLAAQTRRVSTLVSIAGPSQRVSDGLRRQLGGLLPPELIARSEAILSSLERGATVAEVPSELMTLYRPSVQPYLISWIKYAPTIEIAKVKAPCLVVQGDTDIQVQVSDAKALGAAQPNCEVRIVHGMNHVLKLVPANEAKQIASYGDPALPIASELIRMLTEFMAKHVGAPGAGKKRSSGASPVVAPDVRQPALSPAGELQR